MPTASPAPPRRPAPGSLRAQPGAGRRALLRTLLPAACALCGGRSDDALCGACHAQFFGSAVPRCRLCANPLPAAGAALAQDGGQGLCGQCLAQPPAFDATLVAADYAVPLDQLVLQLKFGGRLALAATFKRYGAARVTNLVFARTPPHR